MTPSHPRERVVFHGRSGRFNMRASVRRLATIPGCARSLPSFRMLPLPSRVSIADGLAWPDKGSPQGERETAISANCSLVTDSSADNKISSYF